MKRPRIRFSGLPGPRLTDDGRRFAGVASLAFLLLAGVAVGWATWSLHGVRLERQQIQNALAHGQQRQRAPSPRAGEATTPPDAAKHMDAVTMRLNVAWSELLDAIERNTSPKVAILSLEPDAMSGSVALTAEARSLDDLLAYAEALRQDGAFAAVQLGQHDSQVQEPDRPVRMSLSIRFRGAAALTSVNNGKP